MNEVVYGSQSCYSQRLVQPLSHCYTGSCVLFQISFCKEESEHQLFNKYNFKGKCFEFRQKISSE